MKKRCYILLLAVVILLLSGCAANKNPLTSGGFDGQNYTNNYFGLSFEIPQEWSVTGTTELAQAFGVEPELLGDISSDKDKLDRLKKLKVVPLAYVSRYEHNTSLEKNYNFSAIAQSIKESELKVDKNMDYIETMVKQIADKKLNMTVVKKEDVKINSVDFAMMETEAKFETVTLKQRIYCTIQKGYVLSFTISYLDDDQLGELEAIVNTIAIK